MAVKFMDINLVDVDATYTLTSADTDGASVLYDNNRNTKLTSVGSDDVTPEVWIIEFAASTTIDRIHIDNHNIKAGDIKYWNGSSYADFSTAISYSSERDPSHYHEFNSVSTTKVRITMNTAQTVDAEKYVGQFRCFVEIGEVATNPSEIDFEFKDAKFLHQTGTGRTVNVTFAIDNYSAELFFSDASDADITIFRTLKNRTNIFYIFPGGGDTTYTQEGFRIRDIFPVTVVNDFKPRLKGNLLGIGTVYAMEVRRA